MKISPKAVKIVLDSLPTLDHPQVIPDGSVVSVDWWNNSAQIICKDDDNGTTPAVQDAE